MLDSTKHGNTHDFHVSQPDLCLWLFLRHEGRVKVCNVGVYLSAILIVHMWLGATSFSIYEAIIAQLTAAWKYSISEDQYALAIQDFFADDFFQMARFGLRHSSPYWLRPFLFVVLDTPTFGEQIQDSISHLMICGLRAIFCGFGSKAWKEKWWMPCGGTHMRATSVASLSYLAYLHIFTICAKSLRHNNKAIPLECCICCQRIARILRC